IGIGRGGLGGACTSSRHLHPHEVRPFVFDLLHLGHGVGFPGAVFTRRFDGQTALIRGGFRVDILHFFQDIFRRLRSSGQGHGRTRSECEKQKRAATSEGETRRERSPCPVRGSG